MYRLLIVTQNPQVEAMFSSLEGWEAMGFKPPRVRASIPDAVECMQRHHIDAIGIDLPGHEAELTALLDEQYPTMPIFHIAQDAEEQRHVMREVSQLLNRMHADDSNDDYDENYYFALAREGWLKKVISGMAPSCEFIRQHGLLHRYALSVETPCIYARLSVPTGDSFLTGRWHYGSDRLEMALRNFFGAEHEQATLHLAVVSPEEVRVLVCPTSQEHDARFTVDHVLSYIEDTVERIQYYLGLPMHIIDIRTVDGLYAFVPGQA